MKIFTLGFHYLLVHFVYMIIGLMLSKHFSVLFCYPVHTVVKKLGMFFLIIFTEEENSLDSIIMLFFKKDFFTLGIEDIYLITTTYIRFACDTV